jgi:deoxycytidylate deaminase
MKKVAIGTSSVIQNGPLPSIHAEHNAINKLTRLNRFRRFIKTHMKFDIVVIRLSRSGVIGYSRPCKNCLTRLMNANIPINNIYYTGADGSIIVEKFSEMYNSNTAEFSKGDLRKMQGIRYQKLKKIINKK